MTKLFGIPMTTIMIVMLALFAFCLVIAASMALSNRMMFRMGLRNVPRRGAQTTLVILGLMLGTLIVTAAFATGDSIAYSVTKGTYDGLRKIDLLVTVKDSTGTNASATTENYVSDSIIAKLDQQYPNDPDIDSFNGLLLEAAPVLDTRTKLSKPGVVLAGVDPQTLSKAGGLQLHSGGMADLSLLTGNHVYVTKQTASKLDIKKGDTLNIFVQSQPQAVQVIDIIKNQAAAGVGSNGGLGNGGIAVALPLVQQLTGHPGMIDQIAVTLRGGERGSIPHSDAAANKLKTLFASDQGQQALGLGTLNADVTKIKQQSINSAELFGNIFTTIFLVLGLFSIAAGVLLIFMIFVMLAAERKPEMGMARAIGAQRVNLVQAFLAEGMAYNLVSGLVGAALGVLAAFALVIGGLKLVLGSSSDFLSAHVTVTSLVVSYCLGVVITFVTVVISSVRISGLNIVGAIRGTDEVDVRRREKVSWPWVIIGIVVTLSVVLSPLGLWFLLFNGLKLSKGTVFLPVGLVVGVLGIVLASSTGALFFWSMGISLILLCIGSLLRFLHLSSRLRWTAIGVLLGLFWLLPLDLGPKVLGRKLDGNIEMFVLSGIMIVAAFTMVIVFNARLLTLLFESEGGSARAYVTPVALLVLTVAAAGAGIALGNRGGGLGQLFYLLAALLAAVMLLSYAAVRFPRLAPALKMAVAYPLDNRFRTGLTIAMFSLIIFSITVMSVLNSNFAALFSGSDAKGGWDIVASTNRNNPIPDLRAALQHAGVNTAKITGFGRTTAGDAGVPELRQPDVPNSAFKKYPVRTGDADFFNNLQAKFDARAARFSSDADVYSALRSGGNFALIDAAALPANGFSGRPDDQFALSSKTITASDKTFAPLTVEYRDPLTGRVAQAQIIGVFSSKVLPGIAHGLYIPQQAYTNVFGQPDFEDDYLRLVPKTNADQYAKSIEAALVQQGVQADSIQKQIDDAQQQTQGFDRIFQGFLGLGLLVGIAALGVIAFRAVVERRQQIGMLRAIGYQRGTVALSFVFESSFIALMGILSGVVGAAILSRNLLNSDSFTSGASGLKFAIPWGEVVIFVVVAYLFSLLMTWWPSRTAANVPIADALRYE